MAEEADLRLEHPAEVKAGDDGRCLGLHGIVVFLLSKDDRWQTLGFCLKCCWFAQSQPRSLVTLNQSCAKTESRRLDARCDAGCCRKVTFTPLKTARGAPVRGPQPGSSSSVARPGHGCRAVIEFCPSRKFNLGNTLPNDAAPTTFPLHG